MKIHKYKYKNKTQINFVFRTSFGKIFTILNLRNNQFSDLFGFQKHVIEVGVVKFGGELNYQLMLPLDLNLNKLFFSR